MKAVVAAFNQEKALVGAFSVITNLRMELFKHYYLLTEMVRMVRLARSPVCSLAIMLPSSTRAPRLRAPRRAELGTLLSRLWPRSSRERRRPAG